MDADWRLLAVARMVLAPGNLVVRIGDALAGIHSEMERCVGRDGKVEYVDPGEPLDGWLAAHRRPALVAASGAGHEAEVLRRARHTLLRWRPVVVSEADPEATLDAGATLFDMLRALRRPGYVVRAVGRFGLRRPDTSIYADPCHWIAVPCERRELLSRISSRILWAQLLPPWTRLKTLASAA